MITETLAAKESKDNLSIYRHVFCDLDHTIASFKDGKLHIPSSVVSSINKLDTNIGFSISTARCLEDMNEIEGIGDIVFRSPLILENGAVILAPDMTVIRQHVLAENTANDIISFLNKFDIWKKVCSKGKLTDFDKPEDATEITKIALQDLTEEMLSEIFQELSKYPDIAYFRSEAVHKPGTFTLDITNIQATKQNGVFTVLEMKGLDRSKAIGIGDSYNDLPMLEACGLKVAVANAKPSILKIADMVIPSCESGGVSTFLPKLNFNPQN